MSDFIDVAADLAKRAHESKDEKITALMDTAISHVDVATLLLRYGYLKDEVDELKGEIERSQDVRETLRRTS